MPPLEGEDGATPMEEDDEVDEEQIEKEANKILQDGYELVLPSGKCEEDQRSEHKMWDLKLRP